LFYLSPPSTHTHTHTHTHSLSLFRHNIPKHYGSYGELVNDPEVQVVYISSPHPFHLKNACLALDAGKHVLCEKVICMNATQCTELIACARRNQRYLMEAMWTRFFPLVQTLCARVRSGEFGAVLSMRGSFGFKDDKSNDRISRPELGKTRERRK
jgi:dihydrodiol dehydrogenase / D-xylose 1-dehydrogenase (NADP)